MTKIKAKFISQRSQMCENGRCWFLPVEARLLLGQLGQTLGLCLHTHIQWTALFCCCPLLGCYTSPLTHWLVDTDLLYSVNTGLLPCYLIPRSAASVSNPGVSVWRPQQLSSGQCICVCDNWVQWLCEYLTESVSRLTWSAGQRYRYSLSVDSESVPWAASLSRPVHLASRSTSGGFQDGHPSLPVTVRHGSSPSVGWSLTTGIVSCVLPHQGRIFVRRRTYSNYGDRCFFAPAGPKLWNSLPANLWQADISFQRCKQLLKTFLFGCWDRGTLWLTVKAAPCKFSYIHMSVNRRTRGSCVVVRCLSSVLLWNQWLLEE